MGWYDRVSAGNHGLSNKRNNYPSLLKQSQSVSFEGGMYNATRSKDLNGPSLICSFSIVDNKGTA